MEEENKMMCKCKHHGFVRLLHVLAGISAILFFWAGFAKGTIWGQDASFYAWSVVVLTLAGMGTKSCSCCGH